jgi:protein-L-isoaspartate(D-aspartate) O-methyltransferase
VTSSNVGRLQQELADHLAAQLEPAGPWLAALRWTPRHRFLPDRAWQLTNSELIPVDRNLDPQRWLEAAYSLYPIVTQLDERSMPTSSCSAPYMVVRMLQLLAPEPRQAVLEIGTGTGWNAALLSSRLGQDQVVTVELDAHLAEQARRNLAGVGILPTVVTGDGVAGFQARAPYERIIATCAVNQIPRSWVEQAADGGVIVTPWDSPLGLGGLLRLTVAGGSASGRFVDTSSFMWLRAQAPAMPDEPDDFDQRATSGKTAIELAEVRDNFARFVIGLLVPGCQAYGWTADDTIWLLAVDSWASVEVATGVVRQLGPRRLWDEVEAAYRWWEQAGRPDLTRFGITVMPDRQWVWLDKADNPVRQVAS